MLGSDQCPATKTGTPTLHTDRFQSAKNLLPRELLYPRSFIGLQEHRAGAIVGSVPLEKKLEGEIRVGVQQLRSYTFLKFLNVPILWEVCYYPEKVAAG